MKILLTGASGFVGKHFQDLLPCHPLLDNRGNPLNLLDKPALETAIASIRPEAVVHLAAISSVVESFHSPEETFQVNVIGTLNLLRVLESTNFSGCFIFVGSGEVYGNVSPDDLPLKEDMILKPINPYAASKASAEALAYQWSQTGKFEIVLTRPFHHTGPGQNDNFVVSDFARQMVAIKKGRHEPTISVGNTNDTLDFTDVRDVSRAYSLLLEKGKNGEVYNICSGVERSIGGILVELLNLTKVKAEIIHKSGGLRLSDQLRLAGSFEKLHRETGWSPQIPWQQTLQDIITYWEKKIE